MTYPSEEHARLLQKYGQLISTWNDVEYQWKPALLYFEHPDTYEVSSTSKIISAHLTAFQLISVSETIAREIVSGDCQLTMIEATRQLDILREHRNYYVHGFQGVGWSQDGQPLGFLMTTTAQGRLIEHSTWVDESVIDELIGQLNSLRLVMGQVLGVWRNQNGDLRPDRFELPILGPRPDRLVRSKRFVLDD